MTPRAATALRVATTLAAASLVAASLGLALPARGVLPPAYGGAVRLPLSAVLEDVDPARQAQPSGAAVAAALFDTLYALDAQGAPVAVLAESLPTPSDAPGSPPGTLVVTLRSALRLHEGQRLLAADVVASLRRAAAAFNSPGLQHLLDSTCSTAPVRQRPPAASNQHSPPTRTSGVDDPTPTSAPRLSCAASGG